MKLNEIFQSIYDYEVSYDNGSATGTFMSGEDVVSVGVDDGPGDSVFVSFERGGEHYLTGGGDAPKILGTVVAIVKEIIAKRNPSTVIFTADKEKDGASRSKLYRRMSERLKLPGFAVLQDIEDLVDKDGKLYKYLVQERKRSNLYDTIVIVKTSLIK